MRTVIALLVLGTIAGRSTRHYPAPPHYAAYELKVANAP